MIDEHLIGTNVLVDPWARPFPRAWDRGQDQRVILFVADIAMSMTRTGFLFRNLG